MRATVERSHLLRSLSHVHRVVERRVKKLYITPCDVQTQPMIFFNIRLAPALKTWYTFHKFRNPLGRWIKEPRRERSTGVHSGGW